MKNFILVCSLLSSLYLSAQSPEAEKTLFQIDSLLKAAHPLIGQQNFEEARPVLEKAKELALDQFDTYHPAYADYLFQEGRFYYYKQQYGDAEEFYMKALSIRENALGEDHPDCAAVLRLLGILYKGTGRLTEAEQRYQEAREILEKKQEEEPFEYAQIMRSLGLLYKQMNRLDEAEQSQLEALRFWEKAVGKDSREYYWSVNNLGRIYWDQERLEEAEDTYLKVKAFREKYYGKHHLQYAEILRNLADLYEYVSRYEEAERLYQQVLVIQKKKLGEESMDYAGSLNHLGHLYLQIGHYEKAEKYLQEAKNLWEVVGEKETLTYIKTLDDLAFLYYRLGRFNSAEPLYAEARNICEKLYGNGHLEYAAILNNQADLFMDMGRLYDAEAMYLLAIAIFEQNNRKESSACLWSQHNLGILYTQTGDYQKADSIFQHVLDRREKVAGTVNPAYAHTLQDLGILHEKMGNYQKAIRLQTEARDIFMKFYGKKHPDYIICLNSLARLHSQTGNNEPAESCLLEANERQRELLAQTTRYASETDLASFSALFEQDLDHFFTYANSKGRGNPSLAGACYDNALFYKGFLLTAASQVRNLVKRDPLLTEQFEQLTALNRRIAAEYAKPASNRGRLKQFEEEAYLLEKELTRSVADIGERFRQIDWKDVQAKLGPGEAAIEFIHFDVHGPGVKDSTLYAAIVLKPQDTHPQFISLFNERSLDSLLQIKESRNSEYVERLYSAASRGFERESGRKRTLNELIWQPLRKVLGNVQTVYFSPSGLLHRLNLDAISIGPRAVVADSMRLIELGSTRQLVIDQDEPSVGKEVLLVGGVVFEVDSLTMANVNAGYEKKEIAASKYSAFRIDSTLQGSRGGWEYLYGTLDEIDSLEVILGKSGFHIDAYKEEYATEEAFKARIGKTPSPNVIHLATHGYFASDAKLPSSGARSGGSSTAPGDKKQGMAFRFRDHPMIGSGLLLAGANYAWQTGKTLIPGGEDGILTAYEISQMDLSNTDLVVLSACETGLGDILGNEGVYGLRRALKIAGAKYLIISLWEVSDERTPVLMETFYENWAEEKMSIPDAFRSAQRELRLDYRYSVFDWAGYILVQ